MGFGLSRAGLGGLGGGGVVGGDLEPPLVTLVFLGSF